jgi:hypothetical protein
MATPLNRTHSKALAFLRRGALVRLGGQWRFGTTRVGDGVVEVLVAAGKASHLFPGQTGECVILVDRARGMLR